MDSFKGFKQKRNVRLRF